MPAPGSRLISFQTTNPYAQCYPAEVATKPRVTSYRSNLAFRLSLEKYLRAAQEDAACRGGQFYVRVWTITSEEALSYQEFLRRWNRFMVAMKRLFPSFSCIRVIEVHPGESFEIPGQPGRWMTLSHGLHIHFVAKQFYEQSRVQEVARRCGLGFASVSGRMDNGDAHSIESAKNYLSKYLRKSFHENSAGLRHRRLWAPVNYADAVAVRDICFISRWRVVYERLSISDEFGCFSFRTRADIATQAEMVSRFFDKGFLAQLDALSVGSETRSWVFSVPKLLEILRPTAEGSPYEEMDYERYDYLPAGLGGGWPGVSRYLEWLESLEGLEWVRERNQQRIEADRKRQRERRQKQKEDVADAS